MSRPEFGSAVAIVAALEREVEPLLEGWRVQDLEHGGRRLRFYEKDANAGKAVVVCGGIGPASARQAAEAVCEFYRPRVLVSTGYAGGIAPEHKVGEVMMASAVIDAMHGKRYVCGGYDGVVVSSPGIAGAAEKAALGEKYGADAVDLEAGAVAQVAQEHGLEFHAVKVISDERSAALPPFARFIEHGRFHSRRFLMYVLGRPWLWPSVARIARDSAMASERLCAALAECLETGQWQGGRSRGMRRT